MAVALGKRKRREETVAQPKPAKEPASDNEDLQAIFRRAFEAKFKPLEAKKQRQETAPEVELVNEEDEEDSDWSGISQAEDEVEVVEHTSSRWSKEQHEKQEVKAFMVGFGIVVTHIREVADLYTVIQTTDIQHSSGIYG